MHHNQRIIMWLEQTYGEGNENVKIVIEALKKQIPKKTTKKKITEGITSYYCPYCNEHYYQIKMKHCSCCGQALDWSDAE